MWGGVEAVTSEVMVTIRWDDDGEGYEAHDVEGRVVWVVNVGMLVREEVMEGLKKVGGKWLMEKVIQVTKEIMLT